MQEPLISAVTVEPLLSAEPPFIAQLWASDLFLNSGGELSCLPLNVIPCPDNRSGTPVWGILTARDSTLSLSVEGNLPKRWAEEPREIPLGTIEISLDVCECLISKQLVLKSEQALSGGFYGPDNRLREVEIVPQQRSLLVGVREV